MKEAHSKLGVLVNKGETVKKNNKTLLDLYEKLRVLSERKLDDDIEYEIADILKFQGEDISNTQLKDFDKKIQNILKELDSRLGGIN